MLVNYSSKLIAPIAIAGMMTVCDVSVSDCGKTTFFGGDVEESLL